MYARLGEHGVVLDLRLLRVRAVAADDDQLGCAPLHSKVSTREATASPLARKLYCTASALAHKLHRAVRVPISNHIPLLSGRSASRRLALPPPGAHQHVCYKVLHPLLRASASRWLLSRPVSTGPLTDPLIRRELLAKAGAHYSAPYRARPPKVHQYTHARPLAPSTLLTLQSNACCSV